MTDVLQIVLLHLWETELLFKPGMSSTLLAESVKLKALRKVIYGVDV